MRRLKKATAIALAVVMMFSTVVGGNTVQAETSGTTEYQSLVLDQEETVTVDEANRTAYFSFTPETSDYYIFRSLNASYELDPYVDIYQMTDTGIERMARDDDGGGERNFKMGYSLTAGETYYYHVHHYGEMAIGTYQVVLIATPIAKAEFAPIEIIENNDGYYQNEGTENEFFYYNWQQRIQYTLTMKDDSIIEGSGWGFNYEDSWYSFGTTNGQYDNHWTVGNTYTEIVDAFGCKGEVQISIVETPVQSVDVAPITIIENSNGSLENQGAENEYYRYHWNNRLTYTITMKDGQVITGTNGSNFEYNGQSYYLFATDDQYNNHWEVNNTYTPTVRVLGYEKEVQVSIIETPVQNIEVQPISVMEYTNGYWNGPGPGVDEEFYYYNWYYKMDFVVTMKDGQVITRDNSWSFQYNNEWYYFSWTDDQWNNHWTLGNTYTPTVSVMGYETVVDVTIIDTPVQSVVIEPVSVMEGTNGSLWNEGTEDEFYHYNWTNAIRNYTITMKDGTVYTAGTNGNSFQYDGEWYHFTMIDDQENNHWKSGETYTATASIMGCNTDVEITITESPVEKIVLEPITFAEHTNGMWQSSGPGPSGPIGPDSWYRYWWHEHLQYTVTLKDGRVIQGRGSGFSVDGQYYRFSWNDTQHNEHWYAGNTYTASVNCLGKTVETTVSICEKNQTDGYEYMLQDGNAIIIGCDKEDTVLNIPSVVDGYPVIGITDLTYAMEYAEELVIPDSVTMLSGSIFEWNYDLKKLTIGKGISNIYNEMFIGATCLEEIIVSEENPYYCSVDGVVYDKNMTTLIVMPRAKEGTYTVPDTVTDIDCLVNNISYYKVQLDLGNSNTGYAVEDGVIYDADKTIIYACDKTKTGTYVMPNTVTTINERAFHECSFSEVVVSENVSEIVYAAFSYSMELEKVVLPEKLKAIGLGAFGGCENLAEADLPSGLETLDASSFYKTGITSVTIPGTVTEVGYGAYKESQVAELTLEEGIEVIWGEAFRDTQLKSVIIPDSITHMGGYDFADTPLESVTIGAGLEAISYNAFENTKLTTVTIPENIAEIGDYAFANSTLEEAIIERNDVYIYEGAFYNCPLKEIDLKDGVVAISDYAFYGNQAESVVIPDSVTDVTYMSFAESKKLVNIDVPDELETIDGTAFDGTAWWDAQADGVVYLENYLYGYKGKMPEGTEVIVKDGTTLIASYAFNNEHNLKSLNIPSSVKDIGHSALTGCLGLEKIEVAEDNTLYYTNEEGTILYGQNQSTVWKKVEEVSWLHVDSYVQYGMSAEEWLASGEFFPYVDVTYVDGSYGGESCVVTADMISGYDSTKLGYQTVTVDFGKFTCETEIYIDMPVVESIKISKLPNKTEYDINQSFRPTGMVVSGVTADGTEIEIKETNLYDIRGFDSSEAGIKTITVVYDDLEATFEVEVTAERITHVASTTSGGTTIEISSATEAVEEGATLVVDEKPVEDLQEEVEVPEIFTQNNSQIFDIRFEKEVETGFEVVQPTETVEVRIPVPEGMDGRNSRVYHITNGEPVDMNAVYSDGFIVFDTPHFSYYGIVEVDGSSISGVVNYTNVTEGDVTVTLSKDNAVCDTVTAVDGCYNFTGLQDGTYTLKIEKIGHATREYEVIIGGESVEQDGQIRLIGDVNGDGKVNIRDWNAIKAHMNETELVSGYAYNCGDTDNNGKVNIRDWNAIKAHMDETKPLW